MSIATPKGSYGELYPLVFNVWGRMALAKPFMDTHEAFKPLSRRYQHEHPLIQLWFHDLLLQTPRHSIIRLDSHATR